jgi:hypothetical protein
MSLCIRRTTRTISKVMCRTLVSVDYRGYLYDCDFNQMLGIPLVSAGKTRRHLTDSDDAPRGAPIPWPITTLRRGRLRAAGALL